MSKIIDISSKLTNERPTLKLSETMVFEIDDSKNNVLKLNQKLNKANVNDIAVLDEIIKITLGEKQYKEIDKLNLSLSSYQTIFIAIMAGISRMEYEEAETRFLGSTKV